MLKLFVYGCETYAPLGGCEDLVAILDEDAATLLVNGRIKPEVIAAVARDRKFIGNCYGKLNAMVLDIWEGKAQPLVTQAWRVQNFGACEESIELSPHKFLNPDKDAEVTDFSALAFVLSK